MRSEEGGDFHHRPYTAKAKQRHHFCTGNRQEAQGNGQDDGV